MVIEHHLDVLADADYLLELGPDGGSQGGRIIARGTPEQLAATKGSITGPFLATVLKSVRKTRPTKKREPVTV
jgi:excinuclease ABC subunit A